MANITRTETITYILHNISESERRVLIKVLGGEDLDIDESNIAEELLRTLETIGG